MEIVERLDRARASVNVLEHSFYQRWNAGELSRGELAVYAGEYRRAVLALAEASARAAAQAPPEERAGLLRHALEERDHVSLWDAFAHSAGADSERAPEALPETDACVQAWTAGDDLLEQLAVLYVLEAGQPQISRTKLEGLSAHYGYSPEGPATEYFTLHERLDVEHSRQAAELIARLMAEVEDPEEQAERMLERAHAALRGNWRLLDGVEARARA